MNKIYRYLGTHLSIMHRVRATVWSIVLVSSLNLAALIIVPSVVSDSAMACPPPLAASEEVPKHEAKAILSPVYEKEPVEPKEIFRPNQAVIFFSVFGVLTTLYMLMRKKSSMWIIGGALGTLFSVVGFLCV
jgi:hypothetical protein